MVDCIHYSVDDWCYEVPAGGLSPGLTPEEVARCELQEEAGGCAADLRYVGEFYTSNGISNEVAHVYLATGVELGEAHREPTELMEIRRGCLSRKPCAWRAPVRSPTGRVHWRSSGASQCFALESLPADLPLAVTTITVYNVSQAELILEVCDESI